MGRGFFPKKDWAERELMVDMPLHRPLCACHQIGWLKANGQYVLRSTFTWAVSPQNNPKILISPFRCCRLSNCLVKARCLAQNGFLFSLMGILSVPGIYGILVGQYLFDEEYDQLLFTSVLSFIWLRNDSSTRLCTFNNPNGICRRIKYWKPCIKRSYNDFLLE